MSSGSFGGNPKRQRVIYHPVNHNRPPQFQASQQSNVRPVATYQNPQHTNASGVFASTPQGHKYPYFNCGKPSHFSRECPYPSQSNPNYQKAPTNQLQGQAQNKGNNQNAQKGKDERKTGRVFYIQAGEILEGEPVMMGIFPVANHPTVILFLFQRIAFIHQ